MVGLYVGISIGCIFAGILMIIAFVLCVKELYHLFHEESPSRPSNRSNHNTRQDVESRPARNPMSNATYLTEPNARRQPPIVKIITPNETRCIRPICFEVLQRLKLPKEYFEPKYDCCYCPRHYPVNRPKTYKTGGYIYTLPCGWMRFGLKCLEPRDESENFFQTWATSFHGVSTHQLENILHNRFIPLPGDRLLNGEIFSPKFFDPGHCYTSPSIYYTSRLNVCEKYEFRSQSNEYYQVRIVLQCKQKPNTFEITHGRQNLCNIIPANQIKWKSSTRSTIIPYGLLVHIVKQ
jgi:hypothetical protein